MTEATMHKRIAAQKCGSCPCRCANSERICRACAGRLPPCYGSRRHCNQFAASPGARHGKPTAPRRARHKWPTHPVGATTGKSVCLIAPGRRRRRLAPASPPRAPGH